eukprot:TRINITY_DN22966_c0_g1_i1.p1 TRINITY_DN22966_c0_g1~~TRINITY_DN22966_c0_g1_i1.p1  ORF type:complete len:170 (+),score=72.72 TRINITY_DN22966_c0_g1_i1:102-611(+)
MAKLFLLLVLVLATTGVLADGYHPLHTVVTVTTGTHNGGLSQRSICNGCLSDFTELQKDVAEYLNINAPYVELLDYETFNLPGFTARFRIHDAPRSGNLVPGILLALELRDAVENRIVQFEDYNQLSQVRRIWIDTPSWGSILSASPASRSSLSLLAAASAAIAALLAF